MNLSTSLLNENQLSNSKELEVVSLPNFERKKEIWTFGGGKGGVGKSVVCSNIGLHLTQRGYRVLLVDADFGAANLHTYLGMSGSDSSLSDFLFSNEIKIDSVIEESNYQNLFIINGGEDPLKISNPRLFQVNRLLESLVSLNYDYILIDLGAGTTSQIIDIFVGGFKPVLICTPEPASIENTFRFIKYSFFRGFKKLIVNRDVHNYLEHLMNSKQADSSFQLSDLAEQISAIDLDTAAALQKYTYAFKPKLVMNMVRTSSDINLGFAIVKSCQKYLGVTIEYTGFIENDDTLVSTVKERKPVIISEPFSKSARGFKKIADSLLGKGLN